MTIKVSKEPFAQTEYDEENEKNIFLLGIFVMFVWMLFIVLYASPQLFRDFLRRHLCCCWRKDDGKNDKSIREAQERMVLVNKSFLRSKITENPSNILVTQMMQGPRYSRIDIPEPIPEESRCFSVQPTNRSLSICSLATILTNTRQIKDKSRTHSVSFVRSAIPS